MRPSLLRIAFSMAGLSAAGLLSGGCGLISKDFVGSVKVDFAVDVRGSDYNNTLPVDPNDNPDVKDNRDRIERGSVRNIIIELLEIFPDNTADFVTGSVDVRAAGGTEETYVNAVGTFDNPVPVLLGQKYRVDLDATKQQQLKQLIFDSTEPLDIRVRGEAVRPCAGDAPCSVHFRAQVTFELEFTASL